MTGKKELTAIRRTDASFDDQKKVRKVVRHNSVSLSVCLLDDLCNYTLVHFYNGMS